MFSITQNRNVRSLGKGFRLVLCCTLLTVGASAQTAESPRSEVPPPAKDKVAETLNALRAGNLAEADIDLLVKRGSVQAIPDLKKQFWITEDESHKGRIASALLRLGDKEPAWWKYLEERAGEAINDDAPSWLQFDANGKATAELSPKFLAWAKVHSLTPEKAEQRLVLNAAAVAFLGESRDRRAIPLLRQGLLSPDYIVQAFSANGLAQLQDKSSIALIIETCEQAPAEAASAIASALVDFDTPEAQNAAKRFRPPQPPR